MTTIDNQTHHALDLLKSLQQAVCTHADKYRKCDLDESLTERGRLARVAGRVQKAVYAEVWPNAGAALEQAAGHLKGYVEVFADVDKEFMVEIVPVALDAIRKMRQALRSRLNGESVFPLTYIELTHRAGLNSVSSVTKQLDRAINKARWDQGKAKLRKSPRGVNRKALQETDARQAYPYLRKTEVKKYLASALQIK